MKRYEDEYCYYIRKSHGIPTTFGSQFSFLEHIAAERPAFFAELEKHRTREEERGLLNRLDNDTAGLLYFAKTPEKAQEYYTLQEAGRITKRYVCDVKGDMRKFVNTQTYVMRTEHPFTGEPSLCVSCPIMHHAYDDQKMIVVRQPQDTEKGRGKQHMVKTYFQPLYYDEKSDITTTYALISTGIRHQIRVHAAAIGYPLIGDILYKGNVDAHLHLWSLGLTSNEG